VETFTNILSEIRSYGEGLLVVEQIPTKLAPDVIKNTNLKVMHRIVAADDRRVMGATMNIEDRETRKITALNVGEAVVYSEGDEGAYHIRVPYSKIETRKGEREQEEEAIRKVMVSFTADARNLAPFEGCVRYCRAVCRFKSIGRDVSMKYRYASQVPTLTLALLDNASCAESVFLQLLETGDEERQKKLEMQKVLEPARPYREPRSTSRIKEGITIGPMMMLKKSSWHFSISPWMLLTGLFPETGFP